MITADPLLDLLAACVVVVERDGRFEGSGFWVAPGELLTCAHVVHGGRPVTVRIGSRSLAAEPAGPLLAADDPVARRFYPQPDVALLRVPDAPVDHPCVWLDDTVPAVGDLLALIAFTVGENAPDAVVRSGASLHIETLFVQDGVTLFKLREGQVIGGFSGGPLLERRTGRVCALVDSSRSVTTDLGGFGVPVALFEQVAPGLVTRNAAFHATNQRWTDAVDAQRRVEAERSGERARLPVLDPVVPLEWDEATTSPSELLRPRHAVVPFVPRGDLLEQVMRWRERDTPLQVLVLAGGGGFGKSRTAAEICRAAEDAGWTAGPLDLDPDSAGALDGLLTWPGRLVVAIDYAETRPRAVTAVLKRLARRPRTAAPCRVVLVVRQAASRDVLIPLFATGDARDEVARLLRRAEWCGLGRGKRELDRRELFLAAGGAFAALFDRAPVPAPDLRAEHLERPLLVTAAALLAVADPGLDVAAMSADELLGEVLDRHEAAYWERADTRRGLGLDPEDRPVAVALAALCGLHDDAVDTRLVGLVPGLDDTGPVRHISVVRWLRDLYGPTGILEPDLLAEVLVTRVLIANAKLLDAVLDQGLERGPDPVSTARLTRALVVTSRAAGRSTAVRDLLRASLDERLTRLVQRTGEREAELAAALDLAVEAARPVLGAVDAQQHTGVLGPRTGSLAVRINELAVDGFRDAADAVPDPDTDLRWGHAAALTQLSITYSAVGRPTDGLPGLEEAVAAYRALAAADPNRFRPSVAMALLNHASLLTSAGRTAEGLVAIEEAVTILRELARAAPTRFLALLASALSNQAAQYLQAGRPSDGLPPAHEAVAVHRALAAADPASFRHELANSLNSEAELLRVAGRYADGLTPIGESVALYRELAATDPTRFLSELANSSNTEAVLLVGTGRLTDALVVIEEAVTLRRTLATADPARFRHELAMSLNSQAEVRRLSGDPAGGLAAIEEAVTLRRALAGDDPVRFLPDLAQSLSSAALLLTGAARPAEGLAASHEAVTTYRELAMTDPTRFLPELARTLRARADLAARTGHLADGLDAVGEAVTAYRELAAGDPTRFLPHLAPSLCTQADLLGRAERPAEGLTSVDEAVTVYRTLAAADALVFLPDLAASLVTRAALLGLAGRPADGSAPVGEAITAYRALATADPDRYSPHLVASLNAQGDLLARAGRPADGLAPIREAVDIARRMAGADPDRLVDELVASLVNQSERLAQTGHGADAADVFDPVLAEYPPGRPRGLLLLARGRRRARDGRNTAAAADAVEAIGLLDAAGDRQHRGRARWLLRELREADPAAVDTVWPSPPPLPPWLRHPDAHRGVEQILLAWSGSEDWDASFAFLARHAAAILSDRGEASLEHLIDHNPYQFALDQYLEVLRVARVFGIGPVRNRVLADLDADALEADVEQWVASPTWAGSAEHLSAHADRLLTAAAEGILEGLVGGRPDLLLRLALLQLSRNLGVENAHILVTEPAALTAALAAAATPVERLPLVRLAAGLDGTDAENHLAHGLTAAELGAIGEATWALRRCRENSATWQRPGLARRLDEFADAHLDVDIRLLREALHDDSTTNGSGADRFSAD